VNALGCYIIPEASWTKIEKAGFKKLTDIGGQFLKNEKTYARVN